MNALRRRLLGPTYERKRGSEQFSRRQQAVLKAKRYLRIGPKQAPPPGPRPGCVRSDVPPVEAEIVGPSNITDPTARIFAPETISGAGGSSLDWRGMPVLGTGGAPS